MVTTAMTGGVCSHDACNSCRMARAAVLPTTRSKSTLQKVRHPRQFDTLRPAQCPRNGKGGKTYLLETQDQLLPILPAWGCPSEIIADSVGRIVDADPRARPLELRQGLSPGLGTLERR